MREEKRNGLPKSHQVGNVMATSTNKDHEKIVDSCIDKPERLKNLLRVTSSDKIRDYAKTQIGSKIKDPDERKELLSLIN